MNISPAGWAFILVVALVLALVAFFKAMNFWLECKRMKNGFYSEAYWRYHDKEDERFWGRTREGKDAS